MRDATVARPLFRRALDRDPTSFRAALGMGSSALMQRNVDAAAKAFAEARNLTKDKDERGVPFGRHPRAEQGALRDEGDVLNGRDSGQDSCGMGWKCGIGKALLVCAMLFLPALPAPPALPAFPALSSLFILHAQHAAFRVKGRVVTERGEPIDKAVVRAEAFFGYAAGTFAGPRRYRCGGRPQGSMEHRRDATGHLVVRNQRARLSAGDSRSADPDSDDGQHGDIGVVADLGSRPETGTRAGRRQGRTADAGRRGRTRRQDRRRPVGAAEYP